MAILPAAPDCENARFDIHRSMSIRKALTGASGLLLALAAPLLLLGCGMQPSSHQTSTAKTPHATSETRTITDMAGRTVTIPRDIESFGYPYPANTLDFLALGVGHKIVLASESLREDTSLRSLLVQWGYPDAAKATGAFLGDTVHSESVLKAKPQVVFLSSHNKKGIRQVTELGIPVIGVEFPGSGGGLAECVDYMTWLGNVFGGVAIHQAAIYKSFVDNTLKTLHSGTGDIPSNMRPTALFMDYWAGNFLGLSNRLYTDAAAAAGGKNVMGGERSGLINKEQMFVWDPDVIMLQTESGHDFDGFKYDAALRHLKAVKNGKVYPFRMGRINTILLAVYMATLFHPDRFSKTYLTDEIVSFHKTMYGVTLSHEAVNSYFTGY